MIGSMAMTEFQHGEIFILIMEKGGRTGEELLDFGEY